MSRLGAKSRRSRGITRIELITMIAVVVIVLAVLFPITLNAIRSANKNSSRSQLKQLSLALLNHHDMKRTFPPLFFSENRERKLILNPAEAKGCYSWQVRILPFIEQGMLHKKLEIASDKFETDATKIQILHDQGVLVSPSEISLDVFQSTQLPNGPPGVCHYVAMSSTRQPLLTTIGVNKKGEPDFVFPKPDGMLIPDIQARGQLHSRISDGTSKTIVLCETREQQRSNWFNPQQAFVCGFLPEDTTPINAAKTEYYPYFNWAVSSNNWVFNPAKGDRTALNYGPNSKAAANAAQQAYNPDASDPLARAWGPSTGNAELITLHGMGDGSVQEVSMDVDPMVYFAAITARGGETAPRYNGAGK